MSNSKRIPVAVLGATGSVGQRFVQLLADHPWFEVAEVVASDRSAGRSYAEATDWRLSADMPEAARSLTVKDYGDEVTSPVAFSALPGEVAGEIEARLAKAGQAVLSNASTYRMDPDVPLVIAEVNPDHVRGIERQKANKGWSGFIITNGNCTAITLTLSLKPLQDAFGLDSVIVTTMQALSGAGYPGVPSLDAVDNVVPFISTEEEKLAEEARKFLGSYDGDFSLAPFKVSASCNRVAVRDGHTEAVSVRLQNRATPEEAIAAFEAFRGRPQELQLPSAPARPVVVRRENNRPQPILDRETHGGMASVVGRVRECEIFDLRYTVLGHNTLRGAAGASVLNAELLKAEGLLPV
ncbi:MAG: aspartate-semialdehyde dehydrogenase [Thermomicrobiales bacterium]|nr:aspartate-semialdehyde dehydrogenase [Thermomicrobiales bacterium]